jgi:hypothetical protein
MKTIDLSDLKVGDKAWSVHYGDALIYDNGIELVGIETNNGIIHYYMTGKIHHNHTHPTLFHSEQEFREYWGLESNTLSKREQFAMAAMQGLIHLGTGVEKAAELAIKHADALLTKLNEKP